MSEPNVLIEEVPNWLGLFPHAQGPAREALTHLTLVSQRLMEQGAASVTLEEHARAVTELCQLVHYCQQHHQTLVVHGPQRFRHAGVECNSVHFELAHHLQLLAERAFVRSLTSDRGSAATPHAQPLGMHTRHTVAKFCRSVRGLLLAGAVALRAHLPLHPPASNAPPARHLEDWAVVVRAYALYNAVHTQLTPEVLAMPEDDATRPSVLARVWPWLVEAYRCLQHLPDDFQVLGGELPFVNSAQLPLDWTLAKRPPRKPVPPPPGASGQPWPERLTVLLWTVASEYLAVSRQLGDAIALGRLLQHAGEPTPRLADWERRNREVEHLAVPAGDQLKALVDGWPGAPEVLAKGEAVPPSLDWVLT